MMQHIQLLSFVLSGILFCTTPAAAQHAEVAAPDTLLLEDFSIDPSNQMLDLPGGDDLLWVNYDQDKLPTESNAYPQNWFWDIDDSDGKENGTFLSCSYLQNYMARNRNWLISSPVYIPDSTYWLCWRSMPFQGPRFLDGYQVMISTKSNRITDFLKDTIFRAAEMLSGPPLGSPLDPLDLNNYTFSKGYIHANGFTDSNYCYKVEDTLPDGTLDSIYWCRLEPHSFPLHKYVGKTIYVAFFHNSMDDFLLFLDDIIISKERLSQATTLPYLTHFKVLQNPTQDVVYLNWKLETAMESSLSLFSASGQLLTSRQNHQQTEGNWSIDLSPYPAGVYHCVLYTAYGTASRRVVKL